MSEDDVDEGQEQPPEVERTPDPDPPEVTCSGGLSLPPLSGGNGGE